MGRTEELRGRGLEGAPETGWQVRERGGAGVGLTRAVHRECRRLSPRAPVTRGSVLSPTPGTGPWCISGMLPEGACGGVEIKGPVRVLSQGWGAEGPARGQGPGREGPGGAQARAGPPSAGVRGRVSGPSSAEGSGRASLPAGPCGWGAVPRGRRAPGTVDGGRRGGFWSREQHLPPLASRRPPQLPTQTAVGTATPPEGWAPRLRASFPGRPGTRGMLRPLHWTAHGSSLWALLPSAAAGRTESRAPKDQGERWSRSRGPRSTARAWAGSSQLWTDAGSGRPTADSAH